MYVTTHDDVGCGNWLARQPCPTVSEVEVSMEAVGEPAPVRRVVVGVDGSETSREALRWAADEALARGAELRVVHAWDVQSVGAGIGLTPGRRTAAEPEGQRQVAEQLVSDLVKDELGDHGLTDIRPSIGRGSAASVLLEAAKGADLLVVGSRGLGGFAGLLLGSVSTKMANHAPCPVVIVRPAAPEDAD
jgi:nucleotide-binding universal stress UspA family protein